MTTIELFPCSGGFAAGFQRAGIAFDFAFDLDANAVESYERNLGHRPVRMDVRDLVRMARAGWRPEGVLSLLSADPPCTPWSRAGKRQGMEDERDMLAETCELIALLKPQAYLIGNVPGLQDSSSWPVVQEMLKPLTDLGYCVLDYAQLDAADYGVPQNRVRPFWFGHLDGPCLRWPEATHMRPPILPGLGLKPWVTCKAALQHLSLEELGRPVRLREGRRESVFAVEASLAAGDGEYVVVGTNEVIENERHPAAEPDAPARTIGAKDRGQGTVLKSKRKRVAQGNRVGALDEPSETMTAKASRVGAGAAHVLALPERATDPNRPPAEGDEPSRTVTAAGRGEQALLEWPWDRPATTIQADERLPPYGHHDANWLDKNGERARSSANAVVLSERAATILQGFPDPACRCDHRANLPTPYTVCGICDKQRGWLFLGKTKSARWSMLGQAMPPPLAEAVARSVKRQMDLAAIERATFGVHRTTAPETSWEDLKKAAFAGMTIDKHPGGVRQRSDDEIRAQLAENIAADKTSCDEPTGF